jgi:hypothetical protein
MSSILADQQRPKWGGGGVSANEYSCTHGAQINFGDLTPYLTYGCGGDCPFKLPRCVGDCPFKLPVSRFSTWSLSVSSSDRLLKINFEVAAR